MSKSQELIVAKNEVLKKLADVIAERDVAVAKNKELQSEIDAAKLTATQPPIDVTPDADVVAVVAELTAAAATAA